MATCGYCKTRNVTIDHVRDKVCESPEWQARIAEKVAVQAKERADDERAYASKPDYRPQWPASDPQKTYILGLQEERLLPPGYVPYTEASMVMMDKAAANDAINLLKSFTRKDRKAAVKVGVEVPEGRYALKDGDGWRFYEVSLGKDKWAGYTFINQLIGSPGDYRKVGVRNAAARAKIAASIMVDIKQATVDYGKQTHHCGRCSSPLTHKRSRAAGYGQRCAEKMGWEW